METVKDVTIPADLRRKLEAAKAVPPFHRTWEAWEKEVIVQYGPKLGPSGLVPFLPGRTRDAIYNMMLKMKVRHTGVAN
jgi:hypothetical protein